MEILPEDVFSIIVVSLSPADVIECRKVCRLFYKNFDMSIHNVLLDSMIDTNIMSEECIKHKYVKWHLTLHKAISLPKYMPYALTIIQSNYLIVNRNELRELTLRNCGLIDISENMRNLHKLTIYNCDEIISITTFNNLKELYITDCSIIPQTLYNTSLVKLSIEYGEKESMDNHDFTNIINLTDLRVINCNSINISGLNKLRTIYIDCCMCAEGLNKLSGLKTLSLSNYYDELDCTHLCNLTSLSVDQYTKITNLHSAEYLTNLDIHENNIKDIPVSLKSLKFVNSDIDISYLINLTSITSHCNKFYDLSHMKELIYIDIDDPRGVGVNISNDNKLQYLSMSNKTNTYKLPEMKHLTSLELNGHERATIMHLCMGSDRKSINLSDYKFYHISKLSLTQCDNLTELSKFTNLTELRLYNCTFMVNNLKNLKILKLYKCKILTDFSIDIDECHITSCNVVNISGNIKKMRVTWCPSLEKVSGTINDLIIDGCEKITTLSHINDLEYLSLLSCKQLSTIDYISSLRSITIERCNKIVDVSNFTHVKKVNLSYLDNIRDINQFSKCSLIKVQDCKYLPDM